MNETNETAPQWQNGTPARVVVAKGSVWGITIENAHGACLRDETGMLELSAPYPGNRRKTENEARRIARAHNVPAYVRVRHPRENFIRLLP